MSYLFVQGPMGVPGFQGNDGVPVRKQEQLITAYYTFKNLLYIKHV